jgi:hypothetical protein
MVWRFKKSLYVKLGFKAMKHDACLFVLKKGSVCIYVAVFVDNLVVVGF